jgi:hypothetical protein
VIGSWRPLPRRLYPGNPQWALMAIEIRPFTRLVREPTGCFGSKRSTRSHRRSPQRPANTGLPQRPTLWSDCVQVPTVGSSAPLSTDACAEWRDSPGRLARTPAIRRPSGAPTSAMELRRICGGEAGCLNGIAPVIVGERRSERPAAARVRMHCHRGILANGVRHASQQAVVRENELVSGAGSRCRCELLHRSEKNLRIPSNHQAKRSRSNSEMPRSTSAKQRLGNRCE